MIKFLGADLVFYYTGLVLSIAIIVNKIPEIIILPLSNNFQNDFNDISVVHVVEYKVQ